MKELIDCCQLCSQALMGHVHSYTRGSSFGTHTKNGTVTQWVALLVLFLSQ